MMLHVKQMFEFLKVNGTPTEMGRHDLLRFKSANMINTANNRLRGSSFRTGPRTWKIYFQIGMAIPTNDSKRVALLA